MNHYSYSILLESQRGSHGVFSVKKVISKDKINSMGLIENATGSFTSSEEKPLELFSKHFQDCKFIK